MGRFGARLLVVVPSTPALVGNTISILEEPSSAWLLEQEVAHLELRGDRQTCPRPSNFFNEVKLQIATGRHMATAAHGRLLRMRSVQDSGSPRVSVGCRMPGRSAGSPAGAEK